MEIVTSPPPPPEPPKPKKRYKPSYDLDTICRDLSSCKGGMSRATTRTKLPLMLDKLDNLHRVQKRLNEFITDLEEQVKELGG